MPPGGPEDLTPPEVVSTLPKADSTNVDIQAKIELGFSERMNREKTEEAIFVSPLPKKPLEFKWHKNRFTLIPPELLLKDKTYVITVGTFASDLHGNKMKKPFSFAFSTGSSIDSGFISGEARIEDEKEPGINIWAYFLSDTSGPDPSKALPDYVTQTDKEGEYQLRNLALGKYRLFTVKDLNRDLLWNSDQELIGITSEDVILSKEIVTKENINFFLAKKDTTKPALVDCRALDRNKIRLEFDKSLDPTSIFNPDNYVIRSEADPKKNLKVNLVYFQGTNTKNIYLVTEEQKLKEKYRVIVSGIKEESGNSIDTSQNFCLFDGSGLPDTLGLSILSSLPKDKEKNIFLDNQVKIFFDQPPEKKSVENSFSLINEIDSSVKGRGDWENPTTFIFIPESLFSGKIEYKVKLEGEVKDLSGNLLKKTPFEFGFTTIDPETLGSLSGKVELLDKEKKGPARPGEIVIIAQRLEPPKINYQKVLEKPGNFLFDAILPGEYIVSAFIDEDGNKKFSLGNLYPFVPSELKVFSPDTVSVRSRWETEGVDLKFK
jgi:uncharacterized protein (DUF2141 family)